MHNLIKNIILDPKNRITVDTYFDSHLIIQLLIEKHSDEYFKFASRFSGAGKTKIAKNIHSSLSRQIRKLANGPNAILKKTEHSIVSYNIHHNISKNALWKRIK